MQMGVVVAKLHLVTRWTGGGLITSEVKRGTARGGFPPFQQIGFCYYVLFFSGRGFSCSFFAGVLGFSVLAPLIGGGNVTR